VERLPDSRAAPRSRGQAGTQRGGTLTEGFSVSQETFGSRSTHRAKEVILASKFSSVALALQPAPRPATAAHEKDFTRKGRGIKWQLGEMKKLEYVREMREMKRVGDVCHAFSFVPLPEGGEGMANRLACDRV